MKHRIFFKNYFAALCAAAAALVWLCCYSVSGGQALLITGIAAVALFLPWHRCPVAARLLKVISAAASFRLGLALMEHTFPALPSAGLWIGWGTFWLLLVYIGTRPLQECAWLVGMAVLGGVAAAFLCSFAYFDGSVEWSGTPWYRVSGGSVVLTGCALTIGGEEGQRAGDKAGALTGILLWGLTAFVPLLLWSREALGSISGVLLSGLRRLPLLPCFDVWLGALCAVLALWQAALVAAQLNGLRRQDKK